MKLITAIIKPFKLDEVREALSDIGVQGVTVTKLRDLAAKKGIPSSIEEQNTSSTFCQR